MASPGASTGPTVDGMDEQTADPTDTGPLPDLPDDAYPPDAEPLDPPSEPAVDTDSHGDQHAGELTAPDVDLSHLQPVPDQDGGDPDE